MELPLVISLIVLMLLLYGSAWISSAETALFSLSSHKLRSYTGNIDPRKQLIANLLAHPRDLLVTVFMVNTCVNILLQNVASDMFGSSAGWGLKVGIPLIITLIFGETIPKYIGLQSNTSIAYRVAPNIYRLQNALSLVRQWVIAITTPISRVLFFFLKKEKHLSKEEIEHVLMTSKEHGVLYKEEAELLAGYLNLQNSLVKELMWPKEDILYYDINQPISKLIHLFMHEGRTRIPVCKESFENVLGITTAMSFFNYQHQIHSSKDLLQYLQKPLYVPETIPIALLLKQMHEHQQVLALVVNEYGTITGLISREDIIEVVVGRIQDSRETQPLFIKAGHAEVIAGGKWELAEFNHYFHSDLKSPSNMVTIGGWLIEQLGDIPKTSSKYELEGFLFQVLAASQNRITRLFIRKLHKRPHHD